MNMNINWYPGHMKKTRESIEKNLSLVDIVFELLDARIPYSSQNPIIDSILKNKPRITILNKCDLANQKANIQWQEFYQKKGIKAIIMDSSKGKGQNELINLAYEMMEEKRERLVKKGIINKPVRAMILGIPNAGKSTLINTLTGRKGTKTGNRPGVTTTNQWIKIRGKLELLDTPGILWPKFEEEKVGLHLAFTGAIKDEILDKETLALKLTELLMEIAPDLLFKRYNIDINNNTPLDYMDKIAGNRGCVIRGGEIDYSRVSDIILDEFRNGIIGNISLEYPNKW